jgi:lipopolysaccharide heptosyltransferase II
VKFLIVQTAFLGDVILATPLVEKLNKFYPGSQIDFMLRKGNESLLFNHPFINKLLIWNKKENKYGNLFRIIKEIRTTRYDYVINVQRFAASGILTVLSGSKNTIGFSKNPFSFLFSRSVKHAINNENTLHETERNLQLINAITDNSRQQPRLHPSENDFLKTEDLKKNKYICIAPASVWFTKQFPAEKWAELIRLIYNKHLLKIYLIGSSEDRALCNYIISESETAAVNLSGTLTLLETSALMKDAVMNYVNDSAPLHIASAMNAPVTAFYCSTIPAFGFGPLSDISFVVEEKINLECRPCGLHGYSKCPMGHFNCAESIDVSEVADVLYIKSESSSI